ncbi:MAG: 2,3-bisphosphoglycerate-independent phosphoglycerate mutase, partial [bacterium]|nr:2,3-bisphosphoglycerate-independent phosphoglycerate mutase [bacterium]
MKPLALIILDGWGIREEKQSNALQEASLPFYSRLLEEYPWTTLSSSGKAVGLPEGVMGNSEVGHMTIGAGRIVYQGLSRIYAAIEDGSFFKNKAFLEAVQQAKKNNSALHLMGLLSDGGVHSHIDHLLALIDFAKQQKIKKLLIHCFMDGRDTSPTSGVGYITRLTEALKEKKIGQIATISGRFWGMDRDKRWDRIQSAYEAIVLGEGRKEFFPIGAVKAAYDRKETDEFIKPIVLCSPEGTPVGPVNEGDAFIFFNFRADRAREITQALTDPRFIAFERKRFPRTVFACMMRYDDTFSLPVAFEKEMPKRILPEIIAEKKMKQLRIAETEKYAHVTYFFNGGRENPFEGEDRALIPSPRHVPTYDQIPEMSAPALTEEALKRIDSDQYDFIVMNFANPDMVGHTAIPAAIIKAVETVDQSLEKIVGKILEKGGAVLLTSDHGNCEQMKDANGEPHTQHTLNPVPFIVIGKQFKNVGATPCGRPD